MAEEQKKKPAEEGGDEEYEIESSQSAASESIKANAGENYVRTSKQRMGKQVKAKSKPKQKNTAATKKVKQPEKVKKVKVKKNSTTKPPPIKRMDSEEEEKLMVQTLQKKTKLTENTVSLRSNFSKPDLTSDLPSLRQVSGPLPCRGNYPGGVEG